MKRSLHAKARRLFDRFLERREPGRLLTVSSDHPAVLAQPWELLPDAAGTYLVHDNPRISVRRRLPKTGGGRTPLKVKPKDRLRLLFVVSRPKEAGFIDPRADALAVLDALDAKAPGRVAIAGFGGQGKSYLAAEAGRWLQRTGLFRRVCWVSYAAFQGIDAVGLAVGTLGTVVEQNLLDVAAATQALRAEPVLLILDNLESLGVEPLRERPRAIGTGGGPLPTGAGGGAVVGSFA